MGHVTQASAAPSDTNKMTVSMWVNTDDQTQPFLMEFGPIVGTADSSFYPSTIFAVASSSTLEVHVTSQVDGASGSNPDNGAFTGTGGVFAIFSAMPNFTNAWAHLLIAVDITDPASPIVTAMANKVLLSQSSLQSRVDADTGAIANYDVIAGNAQGNTVSPWLMGVAGQPFCIPAQDDDQSVNPRIRYAEVQVWFGQYIDPSLGIANFVNGSGKPVAHAVAQAAYGPSDYLLSGNHTGFIVNTGTAGAVTGAGTINDFSPGP